MQFQDSYRNKKTELYDFSITIRGLFSFFKNSISLNFERPNASRACRFPFPLDFVNTFPLPAHFLSFSYNFHKRYPPHPQNWKKSLFDLLYHLIQILIECHSWLSHIQHFSLSFFLFAHHTNPQDSCSFIIFQDLAINIIKGNFAKLQGNSRTNGTA